LSDIKGDHDVAAAAGLAKAWGSGKENRQPTSTNNATHWRMRCSLRCKLQALFVVTRSAAKWWRRGESNPRPKRSDPSLYARVPSLSLVMRHVGGQAHHTTSGHVLTSWTTRPPGRPQDLLSAFLSLSRYQRRNVVALVMPREPAHCWLLMRFPDFLRGQPGFLGAPLGF